MTNFIRTALTVIIFHAGIIAGQPTPSDEGEVTRLISQLCKRPGWYNKAEPFSVPCVPKDLDTVCQNNNFLRAVAQGNPERPDTLRRRLCLVSRWRWRYGSCPLGSTCVRYKYRRGVCCYGDLNGSTGTNNGDPKCPDLCTPPCPSGESCQKCGDGFACLSKVKPGSCPVSHGGFSFYCSSTKTREKCWCRNDGDCAGTKKCCYDYCTGPQCREPSDAPAEVCPSTTTQATSSTMESSSVSTMESSTATTMESSTSSTSGDPPL